MKKYMNIIRRSLAVILVLSVLLPLFSLGIIKAEAEEVQYIDYRDLLEHYRTHYNVDFDTPTAKFYVKIENGNTHFIEPTQAENLKPYEEFNKVPIIDTIKTGTKFSLEEKSTLGSGSKIIRWDWQIYYRDKNGNTYNKFFTEEETPKNIPAPTKEGDILIFLNVADDYKLAQNPNHINANEYGNWRTTQILRKNYTGNPNLLVKGWYFTGTRIKVTDSSADMVMRELELIDTETGKVIESFKREVDNLEPFNTLKQKLIRTSTTPMVASILSRDKTYKVRAKYQFISFEKGAFDISKPELMTPEQREITTEVVPNDLDVHYSYDDHALVDGVFDQSHKELSIDKPYVELKNLEYATFEWEFKVSDTAKKYVKIAGVVPSTFAQKNKDDINTDNWAVVFGRLEPNDIGMHKNVRLINNSNEVINTYRKGEPLRLIFPVEHVSGDRIVGTDSVKNPKVIIHVEVKDEKGNIIHQEKIQTPKLLHPKEVIDMPITKAFTTESNKITACATIDPIHRELGYNDDSRNDKICVTYRAGGVDIGMAAPVELYRNGQNVKYFEANKSHTVQFNVKHFLGDEAVGLDPTKNPKVKINIKVMDANKRLLLDQTVQADQVLNPGATIKMPMSKSFTSDTNMIRACATIDPIHEQLGYNSNPTNDTICADFMMVKNYAIRDLRAYPQSIHFGKNESQVKQNVTLNFTIINESSDENGGKLPSSPIVEIKHGNEVVWRSSVSISPGQSRKMSVTIPNRVLKIGDNIFSVEVNPDRTILEFKPGVSNPYADNKATTSIRGVAYEKCQECMTSNVRKRNDWQEKWEWYEQRGVVRSSTYKRCFKEETRTGTRCVERDEDGRCIDREDYTYTVCVDWRDVPYEYCEVTYRKEWSEIHDYYETFEIQDVLFRSKYTTDIDKRDGKGKDGWVSVKNGGQGKIKAGYGFELKIKTRYRTNRNQAPPPEPYKGNYYSGDAYGRYPI